MNKILDIEAKPGFQTDRLEKFYSASKMEKLTDIQFTIRGRSIFAHKLVLAMSSEIFMKENLEKLNSILSGFDNLVIDALFKYCYTGVINIEENMYEKFKDLATQLEIRNLYYKTIDVKNSLEALKFSNDPTSVETAMYFALENFEKLYETPDFVKLPFSTLTELIKSDNLCVSSEMHVMNSIISWIDEDHDKRRPKLEELLSYVKLPGLAMEINLTEARSDFYSTKKYKKMINNSIDSIIKYQKNTSQRWESVKIVIIGEEIHTAKNKVHIFDSKNNSWIIKEYPIKPRYFASVLVDDMIMIFHNRESTVSYINLKDGKIYKIEATHQKREYFSIATIRDQTSTDVYIIGGYINDKYSGYVKTTSVQRWNTKSKKWGQVAPFLTPVSSHSCSVIDDFIYVTGGETRDGVVTNRAQRYSSKTEEWEYCASMLHARSIHSSTTINGKLYVAGGVIEDGTILDTVEVYDPKKDRWTDYCKLPSPRYGLCLMCYRNKLLSIGGSYSGNRTAAVMEYNDEKSIWKPLKELMSTIYGPYLSASVIPYDSVI